jgi:hypothetical protein
MARSPRLNADIIRLSSHHPLQSAGQIRQAALTHVAIANEVVDGATEQMPRRM